MKFKILIFFTVLLSLLSLSCEVTGVFEFVNGASVPVSVCLQNDCSFVLQADEQRFVAAECPLCAFNYAPMDTVAYDGGNGRIVFSDR